MTVPAVTSFGLGDIDQISFAVANLETSLPVYTALFGPFTRRDVVMTGNMATFRGQPVDVKLKLAFAQTAGIEVELVEVESGEMPQSEHLRTRGEGIHHVRYTIPDLATKRALMEKAGFTTLVNGRGSRPGILFCYMEAPETLGYSLIELRQTG